MNDSLQFDKQALREQCRQLRLSLAQSQAQLASQQVSEHILAYTPPSAQVVAAYLPVRGELDIRSACAQLAARGHQLCLPVVMGRGKPLAFRRWQPEDPLIKAHHGVHVPREEQPLLEPDFLLVPLLAFDDKGRRLGYGAGYYDYTIQAIRARRADAFFMGVAYGAQQMPEVPAGAHDEPLNAVVTERGVMRCL